MTPRARVPFSVVSLILVVSGVQAGDLKVTLGARVDSVTANYSQEVSATEIIIPLTLNYSFFRGSEVSAKMGWASLSYVNAASGAGLDKKLSGLTDFSMAASHAFGRGSVKPFATARFNAPTGDSSWNAYRVLADIPSEFNSGDILGRGLTYGGTMGLRGAWSEGDAEFSGGFIKNESVNPLEGDPELDIQAGAVGLVKAAIGLKKDLDLRFEGTYIGSGATKVDDAPVFKQRNVFIGAGTLSRAFGPVRASLKLTRSYFGRAQIATASGLEEESRPRLAHRDDARLDAGFKTGSWSFGASAGIRKVEANGFRDPSENRYDAGGTGLRQSLSAKTKFGIGILSLGLTHLFVRDLQEAYDADGQLTPVDYRLLSSEVSFSHAF